MTTTALENTSFFSPYKVKAEAAGNRIGGGNRYATCAKIAEKGWTGTSDYAVIATGEAFPDALCAAPLAKKYNAPILLTSKAQLSDETKGELQRLKVHKAIIIGGTGAVSTNTEYQIKNMNITTSRIAGSNRYQTSEMIAEKLDPNDKAVIATGANFPDALSIASIAAMKGMPILLTGKYSIPDDIKPYLNSHSITKTYVVGGTGVVADNVLSGLKNPKRLSGTSRYDTNIAVLTEFSSELNDSDIYLATGAGFPDALSCSALAPYTASPIVLIGSVPEKSTTDYINANYNSIKTVNAIGGTLVVSDDNLQSVQYNFTNAVFYDKNLEKLIRDYINKPSGVILKSDVVNITRIEADNKNISDLRGIENLVNLQDLDLFNNLDVENIEPLASLKNLKYLSITDSKVSDITPLEGLTNLCSLIIWGSNVQDISPLKGLTNLYRLDLEASNISDIKDLKDLKNLEYLSLAYNRNIEDISIVNGLKNLKQIDLTDNQVTDISALNGLTGLTEIDLNSNNIKDISILAQFKELDTLTLDGNKVSDFSVLSKLTNLIHLELMNTNISDISILSGLTQLNFLDLQENRITDLGPLKGLTKLDTLWLSNNNITDIEVLSGLTNLSDLNLAVNNISNINPLMQLKSLQNLYLVKNPISSTDKAALKAALPACNIVFD